MSEDQKDVSFPGELHTAREPLSNADLKAAFLAIKADPDNLKDPQQIKVLAEIYNQVAPITQDSYRHEEWQREFLIFLYRLWPKTLLEDAVLKHNFPEPQANEDIVSGSESVQFAEYHSGLLTMRWGALSRGKYWLKFWDLDAGEVIHASEEPLPLSASYMGRDSSHVLFAQSYINDYTNELAWANRFKETFRRYSTSRGGDYQKSQYTNVRYYKLKGEVVSLKKEKTLEVNRKEYEANPIRGELLPPRKLREQTERYLEWIKSAFTDEEQAEILREDELEKKREEQIVRIKQPQSLTIAHGEIKGYLPAQTTTFTAIDGLLDPKISDVNWGTQITAVVAVEDEDAWLENVVVPGFGLKGMYAPAATSPITDVCISSDGALGLRNGNGHTFGIWNLWTGDCLREFHGHTDRVTCVRPSVDLSLVASGSEDKTLRLWKPITGECVKVFEGHEDTVRKVCISLDNTKILSADSGGVIKLWAVATGECLRTIRAHSNSISGLVITSDGKFAASGSWDKTVRLWNLSDGSCMKTLEHEDWVTSVDLTPDGRYLASSGYDGTRVWELLWRLEPRELDMWNQEAQRYLEVLMNANAAWEGKLSTPVDMTNDEIQNSLRRQGPSWIAWHALSKKEDWHRVWHLNWDIEETLGHAGYGWLTGASRASKEIQAEWRRLNTPSEP